MHTYSLIFVYDRRSERVSGRWIQDMTGKLSDVLAYAQGMRGSVAVVPRSFGQGVGHEIHNALELTDAGPEFRITFSFIHNTREVMTKRLHPDTSDTDAVHAAICDCEDHMGLFGDALPYLRSTGICVVRRHKGK